MPPNPTSQATRHIAVTTPLGEDKLLLRRIQGTEGLSQIFHYDLDMISTEPELKFDDIVGQPISVRIDLPNGNKRHIHGYVSRFTQTVPLGEYHEYKAEMVPWLWLLTRTQDCRIWQKKSVPEIVKEIFNENGFTDLEERITAGDYPKWENCVQYMETDFQFVSRLLEHEGIYYYFKHEESKHTLILCDSKSRHEDSEGYGDLPFYRPDRPGLHSGDEEAFADEVMLTWRLDQTVQPGKFAHTDYNFTTPQTPLLSTSEIVQPHQKADFEMFEFPGEHASKGDGDRLALLRMQAYAAAHKIAKGQTNARAVGAGTSFKLTEYWRQDQNIKYIVTKTEFVAVANDYDYMGKEKAQPYACTIEAIPFDVQYRPPRTTPKPRIHGMQTAKVVGTSGEEIETEANGRVKVQFLWDRLGKADQDSSCWIRVAQTLAGPKWGGQWIPRMGMEVLVSFLGGDPDQPMVTGCVYNEDNKPSYDLPANKTQSGWKTRTTKEGTDKNFNELRFEDKKGSEEIYFHAEKNLTQVVENDYNLNIGAGKKDKGDQIVEIYNDQTMKVGVGSGAGSQTLEVHKDQSIKVATGNHTMEVSAGNSSTKVTAGNIDVKADAGTIVIEAGTSIELKVGGSSIKIEASAITAKIGASTIKMEAAATKITVGGGSVAVEPAKVEVKSPMTTVEGSGQCAVKGAMVDVNGSGMVKVAGGVIMIG